ncbi:MAG: helix-turn-helix domain-containing protein [Acidithiobacillus sp.]|jgi:transcriptional regulator with XRE-family HTH domain/SAM-dependent methyltransferase|uniref:helix-turn-helix domain-containing protein n=1 Tax=Acidithiobacillus sp. TaxID=1872118 RepID=UPI00356A6AAE
MNENAIHLLASNVQKVRSHRGMTLSGLAQRSGVAKSTLSNIESGRQANPTIETVWAIAKALDTTFGNLVEGDSQDLLSDETNDSGARVRFIERYGSNPEIEVYEMKIPAGQTHASHAHPPGVQERVLMLIGEMLIKEPIKNVLLRPGQSHTFDADVEHVYAALQGDAAAMVFIEYPGLATEEMEYLVIIDQHHSDADWDGIEAVVDRGALEVAQGVNGLQIHLRGCEMQPSEIFNRLELNKFGIGGIYCWPLMIFVDRDKRGVWISMLPQQYTNAFQKACKSNIHSLAMAEQLAKMAECPLISSSEDTTNHIVEMAKSSSWAISTLASEVSLQHARLELPMSLMERSRRLTDHEICGIADEDFASRINVDHYDAYELLHPGYARQLVAIAQDVLLMDPQQGRGTLIIDVGTGPGAALLILMELLPELRIHALEPDKTAFAYLSANVKGLNRVHCDRCDFLEFQPPAKPVTIITSVGSSHHFNTSFMLQKAWRLLADDGILCIADELLPYFSNKNERNNALIQHHAAYILGSMKYVDPLCLESEYNTDLQLYRKIRRTMVDAVLRAKNGQTLFAMRECRKIFAFVNDAVRTKKSDGFLGAFVRFYALEIQAMVAGFDYEIECKTYPERLVELANGSGFEMLRHRRVYATAGTGEWAGGTHVFAFKKSAF